MAVTCSWLGFNFKEYPARPLSLVPAQVGLPLSFCFLNDKRKLPPPTGVERYHLLRSINHMSGFGLVFHVFSFEK